MLIHHRYAIAVLCTLISVSAAWAQWEPAPTFPSSPEPRLFAAGLNHDGTLYAIGGSPFTNPPSNDAAVHYLPADSLEWLAGTSVEGPVVRQGAGVDDLGQIVVFGGVDGIDPEGDEGQVYVYDIIEGQYQGLADRTGSAPADYFAWATDAEHRIYSIGGGPGTQASAGNPNSAHVERYIGSNDLWEIVTPLPSAVADAAAIYDGQGHILVFGGIDATASTRRADVFAYDVASNTWSIGTVPDIPVALSGARAVLGADDRVYLMGGETGPIGSGTTQKSVWVLDLQSNMWAAGPDMLTERSHFAAALGNDNYIYAMGGSNDQGGTASVEKLYTPPCPVITDQPDSTDAWVSTLITISAAVDGGTPLTYQWQRNGIDLNDGAFSWGIVSGSQTTTLSITSPTLDAAGEYALRATNPCGETLSSPAVLTMLEPTPLPITWQITSLHPAWALSSAANGVSTNEQAGSASINHPDYGTLSHPVLWTGSAATAVDLTPAESVGGAVLASAEGIQVGWWWWPYTCWVGGQPQTCYQSHACEWHGSADSYVNIHYSGWEYTSANDTDGTSIVGTISSDDDVGNYYTHAVYKPTIDDFWVSLHPTGVSKSGANAVDNGRQAGWIHTPFPGPLVHAAMWSGSAVSFVDLHPVGASSSMVHGAGDGQLVGSATIGGADHAAIWIDSPQSFIDLHPDGAGSSVANDAAGGLQVGAVNGHAAIWTGTSNSFYDLHETLPAEYTGSTANAVHIDDAGAVRIVGSAYNADLQRTEAMLWVGGITVPGDVDGDGTVGTADLLQLLAAWGGCVGCPEDIDEDGVVGTSDLLMLLANWG